jgi:hypothetical protein
MGNGAWRLEVAGPFTYRASISTLPPAAIRWPEYGARLVVLRQPSSFCAKIVLSLLKRHGLPR